jgi:hypothetical protein
LNVLGDFVEGRAAKYQNFGAEHFASWMARALVRQEGWRMHQTVKTEWRGKSTDFRIRPDADGSVQVVRLARTETGHLVEAPLIRMNADQPTVELRLPNSLVARDGLTSAYVEWLTQVVTAFLDTHCTIQPTTPAPAPVTMDAATYRMMVLRQVAPSAPEPVLQAYLDGCGDPATNARISQQLRAAGHAQAFAQLTPSTVRPLPHAATRSEGARPWDARALDVLRHTALHR